MARRPMTVLLPFDTPFYAPLPAGVALGHFADEGLDVEAIPAGAFGKGTIQALLDGDIEISLGGLMRSFALVDQGGPIVVHFAEACGQSDVVLAQLGEHVQRIDVIGVIVLDALNPRDVPDRA